MLFNKIRLIKEAHSSTICGRKGVTKTYTKIRQRYYWDNLKKDIQKYVRLCLQCVTFHKLWHWLRGF